jgi:hypothetical protein
MSGKLRDVREKLQARLALITGSSYSISLAATDAVKIGRYPSPWKAPPCACLFLINDGTTPGPLLTRRERSAKFGLVIWAPATSTDPETREDVLEDVYEDVTRRFRASVDRSLDGVSIDVVPSLEDVVGSESTDTASVLAAACAITVRYQEAP